MISISRSHYATHPRSSPRVTGLSNDSLFGYQLPFSVTTCLCPTTSYANHPPKHPLPTDASLLFLTSQITIILNFFLFRNLRIARDRAWDYTVRSRGKGPEFWKPYVEEWARPPRVDVKENEWDKLLHSWVGRVIVRRGEWKPELYFMMMCVANRSAKSFSSRFHSIRFWGLGFQRTSRLSELRATCTNP